MLFTAAAAFLVLALHPFATYPLSLLAFPRRPRRQPIASSERPSIAICMSAFNEARVIERKVESLLAMARAYGPAKIHIYVDGAQDETAELLATYAGRVDLVVSKRRNGKTFGLNHLFLILRWYIVFFTDANVITPEDGLVKLAAAFADPAVGCATARLRYTNAEETGMSAAGALYWRLEEAMKSLESATVGVLGVDGAFFMIRRELYAPAPDHLIDDLYVSLHVLAGGARVVSVDGADAFERNATRTGEEFRRKARIACQAMNVHRALWPHLSHMPAPMVYAYVSHRLLKWLMPFNLAVSAVLALAALASTFGAVPVGLVLAAGVLVIAAAARLGVGPVRTGLAVLAALAGVGWGVLQSVFRNKTYVVWTPAASIRD